MRDESLLWAVLHGLFAVICTIAIALALGAAWMAITLSLPSAHWWFALPAGVIMGYATRTWVTGHRGWSVVLAVPGILLTAIYMKCLYVGLQLAAIMGVGLVYALRQAGLDMLLALARDSMEPREIAATLVGMALAGWVAWYRRARKRSALTHPVP